MDHVVYMDAKDRELQRLLDGSKSMIIRAAQGRKLPHGRVQAGDWLYFVENNGDGVVRARAQVSAVDCSEKLEEGESRRLVEAHQAQLQLSPRMFERLAGKRFVTLVSVAQVEALEPFAIDRSAYGSMDDWLPVEQIERVRR